MTEKESGILTPEELIDWKIKNGILQFSITPKCVILCPQASVVKYYKRWKSKRIKGIQGTNICIDTKHAVYLSSGWGIGSPAMIAICEEYKALGVNRFILTGMCGRLGTEIKEGEARIIKTALIEEGTSSHYEGSCMGQKVDATDQKLYSKLKDYQLKDAMAVSTDAVFRETGSKIEKWKQQGVQLVDMETSSLFSFAKFYQLEALSILVGADMVTVQWQHPVNMQVINMRIKEVVDLIIKSLSFE